MNQGVCGPRGKRATITTYGCSAGWRNACEYTDVEMIQHTGRVSKDALELYYKHLLQN